MDEQNRQIERRTKSEAASFALARAALYKRLKAIVALPIILALGAAAVTLLLPKRYEASAVIQIDPRQRSKPAAMPNATNDEVPQQTIDAALRTVQSEPVIRGAIEALHLDGDPEFKTGWPFAWLTHLWSATGTADTEAAILRRLTVSRVRNTLLANIRFSSSDAAKSARVANAIAASYLNDWSAGRSSVESAATLMGQRLQDDFDGDGVTSESERVFGTLLSRSGTTLETPGPSLVTKALPPRAPTAARPLRSAAMAFAIGLAAAIGTALLLELKMSTRASRIESVLACRCVTSLPAIAPTAQAPSRACRFVVAEPQGIYAEAVRETCRQLEQRRAGAPSRLTLVVSALAGEGAECLASNIAHQYALAGHSPLLIDADLRTGTLTQQLAGRSPTGLLDQVAGRAPVEEAILRDGATGLNFLPACGSMPIPVPVADILQSEAFARSITALKQAFVTIVVAAPPLLVAEDALVLAGLADDIVFVTAWQKTPKRRARVALNKIAAHQSKLVGAALTDIPDNDDSIMSLYAVLDEMRRAAGHTNSKMIAA